MENKRGRRFTSLKTAKRFSKTVDGEVLDFTDNPIRKSNYKVVYTKESAKKGFNKKNINILNEYYD